MKGNFRIVQLAEDEFVIEKKSFRLLNIWRRVDRYGNNGSNKNKSADYVSRSLSVAKERLSKIKEFPKVIVKI